jgi:hypothetical protein
MFVEIFLSILKGFVPAFLIVVPLFAFHACIYYLISRLADRFLVKIPFLYKEILIGTATILVSLSGLAFLVAAVATLH